LPSCTDTVGSGPHPAKGARNPAARIRILKVFAADHVIKPAALRFRQFQQKSPRAGSLPAGRKINIVKALTGSGREIVEEEFRQAAPAGEAPTVEIDRATRCFGVRLQPRLFSASSLVRALDAERIGCVFFAVTPR